MFLKLTTINSDAGLPNEQVHAIDQDKFGRLWLATPAGLCCYNGSNIKVYDTRSGLDCLGLRTVKVAADGIVWIGTDRGIEAIDVHGKKNKLNLEFEWIYGIAECFLITDDILWVGTSWGLLKLKRNGDTLKLVQADEVGLVSEITKKNNQLFFAVTSKQGLIVHNGTTWNLYHPQLRTEEQITCIAKSIDQYYLAGSVNGLFLLNENQEIIEEFSLPGSSKKVTAITISGDEWWVAFGHTLVLLSLSNTGLKVEEQTDVKSIINHLFIDQLNNLWIATNNAGLKKVTCLRKSIRQIDCGINNSAFSIKEINNKKQLLIGGDGFSAIHDPFASAQFRKPKMIAEIPSIVWDSCIDPYDSSIIWLATQDGLYILKNGKVDKYLESDVKVHSPNRVLLTRDDEIWLGTISGLFLFKDKKFVEVLNKKGNKFGYVYSMALSEENQILIGTLGQGLWIETETGFSSLNHEPLSTLGNTYAIMPGKAGQILIIQEENVILLDKNLEPTLLVKEYPIAGWSAAWLDNHTIATGSNDGIILIEAATGVVLQRINPHLGKAAWQFTSTRALFIDDNQNIYCGINSGLFLVEYKKLKNFSQSPQINIADVVWQNVTPQIQNKVYKVFAGKWSVSVSVFSAWFVDEAQLNYRFKMVGFDQTWSELTTSPITKYNSLPPGNYELQCQAYSPLTGFSEAAVILYIEVKIPWLSIKSAPIITKVETYFDQLFNSRSRNKRLIEKNIDLESEIKDRRLAEQALNKYKEQLEDIVSQRTKDLTIQKERAESADKMKSVFLATMTHEIRTPLGAVIGLNNLLKKTGLNEDQHDYVSKINSSANHLLQIINDILDITKIEAGRIELESTEFTIESVLEDIIGFAQVNLQKHNLEFLIETKEISNLLLLGDSLRIKQVLLNLVSNAIKFTKEGAIILTVKEETINSEKVKFTFSVADTGIGMSSEQLDNIFKAFQQADSSISRKYGGTGLGLNICFRFIEMMGSELRVFSEAGKGSTFYFSLELPVSKNKNNGTVFYNLPESFKQKQVLIIDDNELFQVIAGSYLKELGLTAFSVYAEEEAKEILDKQVFDLIFIDSQLLDSSTNNLISKAKLKNNSNTKLVVLLPFLSAELMDEFKKQGANNLLVKPVSKSSLYNLILDLFELPIEKASTYLTAENKYPPGFESIRQARILIAEDEPLNQFIIKQVLQDEGFNLTFVSNGLECIEELKKDAAYDLILMDIQMPEMDGITASKYIREELRNSEIKIVALSANVFSDTKENISAYGMNDYITKPIVTDELFKTFVKWITPLNERHKGNVPTNL